VPRDARSYLASGVPRKCKASVTVGAVCLSYQICNLIFRPSRSIVRILKSMPEERRDGEDVERNACLPMVEIKVVLNAESQKRRSTQV
jgi:hypothetical protein